MNRSEISDMADAAALLALEGDEETPPAWPSSVMSAESEGGTTDQKNVSLVTKVATKVRQVILAEWLTVGAIPVKLGFSVALKARAIAMRELLSELAGGKPRVLAVSAIGAGGFYRMRFPLSLVEEKGGAALTFATSEVEMDEILAHDVLWVQLVSSARMIDKAKAAKTAGVKVVFEVDDPFWGAEANPEAVKYCTPERVARLWEMVNLADVVVTTTHEMKHRLLVEFAHASPRHVEVAKNCIPARMWSKGRHVPGQILWAGSPSHVRDLEMIAEPLAEVFKRHKGAKLILFGIDPPPKRVIDACQGRLGVAPFIEFEEYPDALARVGAHVAIAPLEDNAWNAGKCVNPSTYVGTKNGLRSIGRCVPHRIHDGIVPIEESVCRSGVFRKATAGYYHNPVPTVKITTSRGFAIEGTQEHRLMSASGSWVRMDALKVGDELRLEAPIFSETPFKIRLNVWSRASQPRGRYKHAKSFYQTPVPIAPVDVNTSLLPEFEVVAEVAELIGAILGDGCVNKNSPSVTITCFSEDSDVVERYCNLFRQMGMKPSAFKESKARAVNITVSSKNFNESLRSIGLVGEVGKRFEVPEAILSSPKSVVRAFLRGLFESDGTVGTTSVSFCTKSLLLAKQTQLLLLGFGIVSSIRPKWSKLYSKYYYSIELGREGSDAFLQEIGFISRRKQEKLLIVAGRPHSGRFIPHGMKDSVLSIEQSVSEVVDVSVPETESYWANGFVSHNSGIKLVEYGACGYPVIASPVGEYTEILRDADDGVRAKTFSDWEMALEHHLSHSCPAMGCGDRLQKRVLAERGEEQCESQWRKVLESVTGRS